MGTADTWSVRSTPPRYFQSRSGHSLCEGREQSIEVGIGIKGLTVRYKKSEATQTYILSVSVKVVFVCR